MPGYTKLFASLLASTVWSESNETRIVWITLLAMADSRGVAEASIPGLAVFARLPVESVRTALERLSAPDPDSRSQEHEGRRIVAIDGGWHLLNHGKYRERLNADERREYLRLKQREYRQRHKQVSTNVNTVSDTDTLLTQPEAEAEAEAETKEKSARVSRAPASPSPAQILMTSWNELTTQPIARCRDLTPKRITHLKARLKERPLDEWPEIFARIEASPFCRGENARGWVASFDWVIGSPDVAVKVLEGKYDARRRAEPTAAELRDAKAIRDKAWGRCRHEPRCHNYAACLAEIVDEHRRRKEE
jgi:hypothetical protein